MSVALVRLSPKWCEIIDNDPKTKTQYYTCIDTLEKCWTHISQKEPKLFSNTDHWNRQKKVSLEESQLAIIHFIYQEKNYPMWIIKGECERPYKNH